MPRLSYITAGESHGPGLVTIIAGLPAGIPADTDFINAELRRRQGGYGRGGRQRIEQDAVEILSGIRLGRTIGSPVALLIRNRDSRLDDTTRTPPLTTPRPGHADLAGSIKYLTTDCRETLERASARETAARTAAGALARCMLRELGVHAFAFVRSVAGEAWAGDVTEENLPALIAARDASETYCPDVQTTARHVDKIRQAKVNKDTVGGLIECHVFGCPPGIGSTMDWRLKLDANLARAVMSIQAIKGVEIGLGFRVADLPGSRVHDAIAFDPARTDAPDLGFRRATNNAGGTEGGMTNGMPIVLRAAMKPISTLLRGMPTVDLNSKDPVTSAYERSDVCAVSAASVVVENVAAFEVASALLEKFGGDSMHELADNHRRFLDLARALPWADNAPPPSTPA